VRGVLAQKVKTLEAVTIKIEAVTIKSPLQFALTPHKSSVFLSFLSTPSPRKR
jgi:hypothetical protein